MILLTFYKEPEPTNSVNYLITPDPSLVHILASIYKNKTFISLSQDEVNKITDKDTVVIDERIVLFNTPILTHIISKNITFIMPHPEEKNSLLIRHKKRIDTMTGMKRKRSPIVTRVMQPMNYNGHIILDIPPALLPARRAGLWKRPERFASSIISHLSTEFTHHPPLSLIGSHSGELFEKITPLLGNRAVAENEKTYLIGTPVLTWSTTRFYHFLHQGLHPLPITKSLARSFFMPSRRRSVGDMLLSKGYTQEMMNLLDGEIKEISKKQNT